MEILAENTKKGFIFPKLRKLELSIKLIHLDNNEITDKGLSFLSSNNEMFLKL